MKEKFIILILTLFVMHSISPFIFPAYSEESSGSSMMELFVPAKMIAGESYQGMITLFSPLSEDSLIILSANDDFILELDSSVIIPANKNHGIFNITPQNPGHTEIFASLHGRLSSTTSMIYAEKTGPQNLKVILPGNSTITDNLRGFVFLLDGNGFPVASDFDRAISIVSSEKIITPNTLTIFNGTTNSSFDITIRATGEITVIGIGLISDTVKIRKSQDTVDVKMAIAPNIALENSYVNYFIWLEKNGRPYNVPNVLKVKLQSSNTDVLRFGVSPPGTKNLNSITISMYDGIASGRLYTGDAGVVEIFASVPDYGHTSDIISVGPVVLSGGKIIDKKILENFSSVKPNHIQFWVYPSITDDIAYGVAALYYSNSTDSLDVSLDSNDVHVTNIVKHTTLIPTKSESMVISISSKSGLKYNSDYLLDGVRLPTNSKIFEIVANNVGEYTITATGGNGFDTANLKVTSSQKSQYSIRVTPLPIQSGMTQSLMMVSIVDENGNIIDISNSIGLPLILNAYTNDSIIGSSKILFVDNVGIVSGAINGVSTITISSDSFGSISTQLTPAGFPVFIAIYTPDNVHAGEAFPIAIHEVDTGGIPVSKKQTQVISSSGFDKLNGDLISIRDSGKQQISILAQIGGAFQKHIQSFTNELNFDVTTNTENIRVGKPVILKIDSPFDGIKYDIDSPFPFEKLDEHTFSITPNIESSDAKITVIGTLDGFDISSRDILLSSENIVELSTAALTLDGKIISPTYDIHLGNNVESTIAPTMHLIKPQQTIVVFPENYSTVAGGYRLIDLKLDGNTINGTIVDFYANSDHTITAIYDRFVQVTVNDGEGSGIYSYGEIIKISAPDKPKLSFLIVEKFDYWIGISDKPAVFVIDGQTDVNITAIYKDDYTILMIVIVLGVVILLVMVSRKGDGRIKYHLREMSDFIISKMKISKIDHSKKK